MNTNMYDRGNLGSNETLSFGPFRLAVAERLLKKIDEPIPLGSRALDILVALADRGGTVVTHKELIATVWPDVVVENANLRVHVAALRKALGDGQDGVRYVSNVAGRGYCFVSPVTRSITEGPVATNNVANTVRVQKLPPRSARMVGRDGAVQALVQQLQKWRFVSIVGPGGVGKTTVAVSVAHTLIHEFHDGVFFVDLSAVTDPNLVPTAVASALGFMVQTQDLLTSLLAFIADKKILVVLDNCEHVIDVAATLAERVFSNAPQAHILATSREALRADGEYVHLLYSLDCPPEDITLTAIEATRFSAVELFMERAGASGYAGVLCDSDAPIVASICRRLDGIALAIELAAGRVGNVGIAGTADLLGNQSSLLRYSRRTALARHETLNSMLDWSYTLLTEREKLLLCQLSIFVGDFTLQAAISVASESSTDTDVIDALASLVAKSLVSTIHTAKSTSYRLLETTRAYASNKLAKRGDAHRIARRHALFYSKCLENDQTIQSLFREHDLSEYALLMGNVRTALEWALSEHGDLTVGVELATWAVPLFIGLSLLEECREWSERALAALDDASRGTRKEMVLQEALAVTSMFTRGHSDLVLSEYRRGLALAEVFEDRARQVRLFAGLNLFLTRIGDIKGALAIAEQARQIAQAARHPSGTVWAEWWAGIAHHFLGDQAASQLHCERGLSLAIELGASNADFFGFDNRVSALVCLTRTMWLRGFPDQGLRFMQMALDQAESKNNPFPTCVSLVYASTFLLWTGNLQRAGGLIEKLIALSGRYSLATYHALGIALKGTLAINRGEPEQGIKLLRSALDALSSQQYNLLVTGFIGALADGLRKDGQLEEATFAINGALSRATSSGLKLDLSELLRIKSRILSAQNDSMSAQDCLMEAITVAQGQSALGWELRSTIDLAGLLSESGQRDGARQTLALVVDRFTEGFETEDLKRARVLLDALR
ncbi:ATP-binding protein [Bradyrhizobium canariense]|uniref:ATP-binding protein n=1 Tax=Bradyrhizobium canariense TaxID=255045 RepID=UPI00117833AD|nr:winged helix-turn-helix domain-containing protein [Bradyrhizobium canariense]